MLLNISSSIAGWCCSLVQRIASPPSAGAPLGLSCSRLQDWRLAHVVELQFFSYCTTAAWSIRVFFYRCEEGGRIRRLRIFATDRWGLGSECLEKKNGNGRFLPLELWPYFSPNKANTCPCRSSDGWKGRSAPLTCPAGVLSDPG